MWSAPGGGGIGGSGLGPGPVHGPGPGPAPGPWPGQWPIQQAMYQNIPHEEVDWAALAQQWIQMRETPDQPKHDIGPSNANVQSMWPEHDRFLPVKPKREGNNSFNQGEWNYNWGSGWGMGMPGWVPPPPEGNKESAKSFNFGQLHGNQGYTAQTYDYNHGSDQFAFNQSYSREGPPFAPFWPQVPIGPPQDLHRDRPGRAPFDRGRSPSNEELEEFPSILDAAKRKQLPGWIREGLEKMEREKQRKMERERMMREREEQMRAQMEAEEEALAEMESGTVGPRPPTKSKFDSDSEDSGAASPLRPEKDSPANGPHDSDGSPTRPTTPSSPVPEIVKTPEERLEDMMTRVRRLLTEVLLEVTGEEIDGITEEVLSKAKAKGLAEYGSGSGTEEDEDEDDDKSSEDELWESINKKKREFAEKEKEIVASLHGKESDEVSLNTAKNSKEIITQEETTSAAEDVHAEDETNSASRPSHFGEDKFKDSPGEGQEEVTKPYDRKSSDSESERSYGSDKKMEKSSRGSRSRRRSSRSRSKDRERDRTWGSSRQRRRSSSRNRNSSSRRSRSRSRSRNQRSGTRSANRDRGSGGGQRRSPSNNGSNSRRRSRSRDRNDRQRRGNRSRSRDRCSRSWNDRRRTRRRARSKDTASQSGDSSQDKRSSSRSSSRSNSPPIKSSSATKRRRRKSSSTSSSGGHSGKKSASKRKSD